MTNIFIWADEWYPIVGGLELALHRTALDLTKFGIDVTVITTYDGLNRKNLNYEIEEIRGTAWLASSFSFLKKNARRGDIVYIARLFSKTEPAQLKLLEKLIGCKIVLRLPSTWGSNRYKSKTYRSLLGKTIDVFIALNSRTYDEILYRFPQKRVELIYNWSPRPNIDMKVKRQGLVYAGRLAYSKNLNALLEAFRLLKNDDMNTQLTLLTDPTQFPGRLSELKGLHAETDFNVKPPYVPGNLLALSEYKFVVLPSFREGCPNVLVEAYAQGTPVIGTAVPGINEHIVGIGAPLINHPISTESIYKALLAAIKMPDCEYKVMQQSALKYHGIHFATERVAPLLKSLIC